MATKIKYVQLEPAAVLLDFRNSGMTAEQFGCYWLIILNLYCSGGKLKLDVKKLGHLCAYDKDFYRVWRKIESQFEKKNGIVKSKYVGRELSRVRRFIQHQRRAGLASARARKPRLSAGSEAVEPSKGNESEVKVSEEKENQVNENEGKHKASDDERIENEVPRVENQETSANSVFSSALTSITARSASGPLTARQLEFYNDLREIIQPRSESDLTCFHRLSRWLVKEITFKRFNGGIFERVLDIARESATGSRNPAAVFMSRLKKELNYRPT